MKLLAAFLLLLPGSAMAQDVPDRAPPSLGGVAFGDAAGVLDGADPSGATEAAKADAERRAVLTVLARNGCRIAERDVERVFAPEGLSFEAVSRTLSDLYLGGVAREDSTGALMIPASLCPPDEPAMTPRDRILAIFRENDCRVQEAVLLADPDVAALSEEQRLAVIGPWEASGDLEIGDLEAVLSERVCGPE